MPVLVVKDGPQAGERIEVDAELVLGREGADFVLDDSELSRRHVRIRPVDGAVEIEDLESLNGTWVNGTRISRPVRLGPGDVVLLGTTVLELLPEPGRLSETKLSPATTRAGQTPVLSLPLEFSESSFDRRMFRVGAAAAVAASVAGIPAQLLHPQPDPDSSTSFLEEIEASTYWLEIHMLAALTYVFGFIALIAIYRSIKSDAGRLFALPGLGFAVAGLAFTMGWFAIDGVAMQNITHDYWEASGSDRETAFRVANAVEDIIFGFFSGSWMFFWGLPIISFGAAVLVNVSHPRWLGWWGLLGGASTFATGVAQLYTERDFLVTDIFIPLSATIAGTWIFAMGVWLWRRARAMEPPQPEAPALAP